MSISMPRPLIIMPRPLISMQRSPMMMMRTMAQMTPRMIIICGGKGQRSAGGSLFWGGVGPAPSQNGFGHPSFGGGGVILGRVSGFWGVPGVLGGISGVCGLFPYFWGSVRFGVVLPGLGHLSVLGGCLRFWGCLVLGVSGFGVSVLAQGCLGVVLGCFCAFGVSAYFGGVYF